MARGAPKGNQYAVGNPNSGRPEIYSEADLEQMAKDLIEWAKLPTSRIYRKWLAEKGIYPSRCTELKARSKVFADAIEYAKYLVGTRREELSMEGEISDGLVRQTAPCYDPDLREWLLELKKNETAAPSVVNVYGTRGSMKKNAKVE